MNEKDDEPTVATLERLVEAHMSGDINIYQVDVDLEEGRLDLYIHPTKTIEYIKLDFVATRSNVTFDEIVGNYGGK